MSLVVEATYENGTLKLAHPLPLREHEKVRITIQPATDWVQQTYGVCGWTGDADELRRLAVHPDLDLEEGP